MEIRTRMAAGICAVLVILMAASASSRVFYVKPNGNDGNSGTSWANAWATPNRTNSGIAAGDTVLFAPGRYRNSQIVPPAGGTSSKRTVYACSTLTAATARTAIISGGSLVTGWSSYSGSIYRASWSGSDCLDGNRNAPSLVQNEVLLQPVDGLSQVTQAGRYYYDGSTYMYVWPMDGANPNSVTFEASCKPVVRIWDNDNDHTLFYGLDLRVAKSAVILFDPNGNGMGDSNFFVNCAISRSTHENGSNSALVKSAQCYTSGDWGEYNTFIDCDFSYCNSTNTTNYTHAGAGVDFYSARNTLFDGCTFTHFIGGAIGWKMGNYSNPSGKYARNNVVRNCVIDGALDAGGVTWGRAVMGGGIWIANKAEYDSVYGCTFKNLADLAIDLHTSAPSFDDPNRGYTFIANNTFYNCATNIQISPAMDIGYNQIKYNIGYNTGSFSKTIGFRVIGGEAPLENPPTEYYWRSNYGGVIDSNMWYTGSASFIGSFTSNSGFTGTTWAAWRAAGFDVNGVIANPNFASPTFGDFARNSSSQEMNRTYGGQTWTRYGAWQPGGVPCDLPVSPTLASPNDGITGLLEPVALDWSDVPTATSYQIQIDNNSDFSSPLLDTQIGASNHSAINLTVGVALYWRVRAFNSCGWGPWSIIRSFTTQLCSPAATPTLATPTDGATGLTSPVALDWGDVTLATNYQVQVDDNSNFASPVIDQTTLLVSSYSASGLSTGTTYYWRVRAQNACGWGSYATARSFTIGACTPPVAATLVSPANGAPNLTVPVALDWNDVATATNYQVQLDDNSDFSSVTVDQQSATSAYSATGLANGTSYYWRVRAQNACGWGSWSSSRFFSTVCPTPGTPTLATPSNGATNLSSPVALDWADVSGATGYNVQVDDNSDFSSTVVDAQPTASSYSASSLASGTTFYWRVRAQNACGWGSWSGSYSFTTVTVDVTAPTITSVAAVNITDNAALITWTTNELSSTQVNYGTTTSYGSTTTLVSTLVTEHEQVLTGLGANTTYHFRARSRDAAGNEALSGDYTFTTTEVMSNLDNGVPPIVSSSYSGYSSAEVTDGDLNPYGGTASTWASTENATSPHWVEVDFGTSRQVKRAVIYWAWNTFQSRWMTSQQFRLQAWNGSTYNDVTTVSNSVADSCTFVTFTPVTTTKIRYYQAANNGPASYPAILWLSEIDLFGQTNTAPSVPSLSNPAAGAQVAGTTPLMTINNSSDTQGNTITYDIQIATSSAFTTIVAQATGLAQGAGATTAWTVTPALTAGTTYYWRARAYDGYLYSNYSSTQSFSTSGANGAPNPPVAQLPLNGSRIIDFTPDLVVQNTTDPNGDPLTYQFYLYDETTTSLIAQSNMLVPGSSTTTWTTSVTLAAKTKYTWRARAYDGQAWSGYSSTRNFRTNRIPLSPTLVSPVDGDTVIGTSTSFIVQNGSDPDGDSITYDIRVFSDSLMTNQVEYIAGVRPSIPLTSVLGPTNLTPNRNYWWQARSNDSTHSSDWTASTKFYQQELILDAQDAPSIVSPENGSTQSQNGLVLTITWSGSSDSMLCLFELSRSADFELLVDGGSVISDGTVASWSPNSDLEEGTYYWRAKRGTSDYSAVSSFNLTAPIYVSPNPFVYSNGSVTIHNLPTGSTFEVFTTNGEKVTEFDNLSGDFTWDVKNASGEKLGSGVFLWYVKSEDKTIAGKLIVQR